MTQLCWGESVVSKKYLITRRDALKHSARAVAAAVPLSAKPAAEVLGSLPTALPQLSLFDYSQVELSPGPLQRQFDENHALVLQMSEDSLLRPFRIREGLPAPGADLGGWYDANGFAPGHAFGQWLSALSRYYAATLDGATRAKVNRMVRGYAGTIHPDGKFYVENRFPAYIYDKLVCGLIDAYKFAGDPAAADALEQATTAVLPHLPPKAIPRTETRVTHHEDLTQHAWDESYTLPENLFLASLRTGERRYRDLAVRFVYHEYFDALARGENALPGKHAYSHINALSSAALAYFVLGDEKYLNAASNGFARMQEQSFATGGWGPNEHFVAPGGGALGDSLAGTHASFETPCGSYAHFKIARYLLQISKDPRYGDSMERVLYNTVLGAKRLQPDGSAFYYSDYNFEGRKVYFRDKWPCCSGTFPQITADYRISAYLQDRRGVYVNLYVPSIVGSRAGRASYILRQTTEYPYDGQIRLDVSVSRPATFSVFLRIPQWTSGATMSVRGTPGSVELTPGTFAEIRREWKNGDRIELNFPFSTRLEPVDEQHPDTVALLYGPLVLFPITSGPPAPLTRSALLSVKRSSSGARIWATETGDVTFKSFIDIESEQYRTYSRVLSG